MNVSISTVYAAMLGCVLTLGSIAVSPESSIQTVTSIPQKPTGDFGPWRYVDDQSLNEREQALLSVHESWRAIYEHRETGLVATVTWMSGDRGPMVSHHPNVCYQREAMRTSGPAVRWKMVSTNDQFRMQSFRSHGLSDESTTVAFAWKHAGDWKAPDHPRFAFLNADSLQRLQIAIHHPSAMDAVVRRQIRQLTMELATLAVPLELANADTRDQKVTR